MMRASKGLMVGLCALGMLASGAADSRAQRLSGDGESCVKTADCVEPLRCVQNTCVGPAVPGDRGSRCLEDAHCQAPMNCVDGVCSVPSEVEAVPLPQRRRRTGLGVAGAIVGGLGLLTGAILTGVSVSQFDEHDDLVAEVNCSDPPPVCKSRDDRIVLASEAQTAEDIGLGTAVGAGLAWGMFVAGGIMAIVGFTSWEDVPPEHLDAVQLQVVPSVSTRGEPGLSARITF